MKRELEEPKGKNLQNQGESIAKGGAKKIKSEYVKYGSTYLNLGERPDLTVSDEISMIGTVKSEGPTRRSLQFKTRMIQWKTMRDEVIGFKSLHGFFNNLNRFMKNIN